MEIRKHLEWYWWFHCVSTLWNVKNIKTQKTLKKFIMNWYYKIHIWNKVFNKHISVHRLVAEAFIPNPENKLEVNHKNWIRNDNRVENLEWCTHSDNQLHSYSTLWRIPSSLWLFWKDNPCSKMVIQLDLQWNIIKQRYSLADIWRETKMNKSLIANCCNHKKSYLTAYWYKWEYNI